MTITKTAAELAREAFAAFLWAVIYSLPVAIPIGFLILGLLL
jgi:hypothetical protein